MKTSHAKLHTIGARLAIAALLVAPTAVVAHEGHHHEAMGTVKMVHENHLVLTTTDGTEKTFVLSESTKYSRGGKSAAQADVTAGERAVVMYESKDGADHALEVKLAEKKP
jgi:hypothetical protein